MSQDGNSRSGSGSGTSNEVQQNTGGVQLPMELVFITVDHPGRPAPHSQLSQITAHAMRRNHERRRVLGAAATRGQTLTQQSNAPKREDDRALLQDAAKGGQSKREGHTSLQEDGDMQQPTKQDDPRQQPRPCRKTRLAQPTPRRKGRGNPRLNERPHSQPQVVTASPNPVPIADMIFGGTRTDPFLRYPIPERVYFPQVLDVCRTVVAPAPAFLELVMSHDVLFEALVCWVLCTRFSSQWRAIEVHHNNTLSKVRQLLEKGPRGLARRALMAAISNLAGVCVSCRRSSIGDHLAEHASRPIRVWNSNSSCIARPLPTLPKSTMPKIFPKSKAPNELNLSCKLVSLGLPPYGLTKHAGTGRCCCTPGMTPCRQPNQGHPYRARVLLCALPLGSQATSATPISPNLMHR
jgi:hypothetical protein